MSRWPESKTLKFIRIYKQNRCLWDTSMPEYKNKVIREQACQNMIQQMQAPDCTSVYHVKHKIKNLRSTYHQELKKVRDSLVTGDGSHDKPTLGWFYEMHSFIGGLKQELHSMDDLSVSDSGLIDIPLEPNAFDEKDETNDSAYNIKKEHNFVANLEVIPDTYPNTDQLIDENPTPPKKRRRQVKINPVNYLESTPTFGNPHRIEEDEFYYFALNIAAQLRQMPLNEALRMQVTIQNKLLFARSKILRAVTINHVDYETEEDSDEENEEKDEDKEEGS